MSLSEGGEPANRDAEQRARMLERLLDRAQELLCIVDFSGKFRELNAAWQAVLGYSLAELRTTGLAPHVFEEDRGTCLIERARNAPDGSALEFFDRLRHRDGSLRWLSWSALVQRDEQLVYASARDVTEQLRAERALRERDASHLDDLNDSEARHRAILDAAIDGIITTDELGAIEVFNPAAERLFGYDRSEVLGKNVSLLMPSPDRERHDGYLAGYRASTRTRPNLLGREVAGLRKSGEVFPLEISVSEVRYAGRRSFTGILRDLTERKKVEQLKDEFVSTVSHELRTPLTSIRGALALLLHGGSGSLPESAQSMLQIAHRNSERLVRLINDLLDVQKIESGALEFVFGRSSLLPLLEQAIEANRAFARQLEVQLELGEVPRHAFIQVDADRMLQVLTNLLSNAAKFSHAGGSVTLAARISGGQVRISVSDRGPGIPLEFRERIFQKFAQADGSDARRRGGTGLGLSIARALVEHMGGNIDFVSELGRGTTFFVDLPVVGPPSLPPQALTPRDTNHR